MSQKLGQSSYRLDTFPCITSFGAVVGKKEGEGPLSACFDEIYQDTALCESSWEKAESRLQTNAVKTALKKANLKNTDIDLLFAGDLLNQCIGSSFGLREFDIPFYGLYGACSTMAESLSLAALFADNYLVNHAIAVTSSHFCSAERQFRFPLEYGGQRTPTAQWTVTGSGAIVVSSARENDKPPYIKGVCVGKIEDLGIKDINNMGAAMAPAAADTICRYLADTNTTMSDYDRLITGDLGGVGSILLEELLRENGIATMGKYADCGKLIFNPKTQDVHAGGSGCGCGASVLCGYLLQEVASKRLHNLLFVATGALMSTLTIQQGESIPAIAHLVHITDERK